MINRQPLYGVIFDMDGVLVESYQPHFETWRSTAREYDYELTEQEFSRNFGRTTPEILRHLLGEDISDEFIREFDRRKEAIYRDLIRHDIPATPGLCELLEGLHQDRAAIAVGSSGPIENIDLILDGLRIRHYFSAIVSAKDVTRGKPDPQVFLIGAEKIGVDPSRCVVIEDAVPGIQAARRAGMKVIALTTSHQADRLGESDLIARDFREIKPSTIRSLIGLD